LAPEVRDELLDIYRTARTIAVVGASGDSSKPANEIPAYLQSQGYRIVPVNPRGGVLFGEPVFRSLEEVAAAGLDIDVVDVFRPPVEAPELARQAVALGARVFWLQYGIESEEAAGIAAAGGLAVVMNRCMGVMHQVVGLGPGPHSDAWRRPAP
jgi:predicted CoA-binding protein